MKKILITLFLLFVFLFNLSSSLATNEKVLNTSSSSAESETIDYALAYPGLLPNHPFYIVKVARDAIIRFFISDPFKRAEFDLLQADKRLNAGYFLFSNGPKEEKRAISTISKGENYFENAIKEAVEAEKQGRDINGFWENMFLSSKKHQQVLAELKENISTENKPFVENELKRVQDFEKMVSKLKAK